MIQQTVQSTQNFINTFQGQLTVAVTSGVILAVLGVVYANRGRIFDKISEWRRMRNYQKYIAKASGTNGFLTNDEIEENMEVIKVIVSTSPRGFSEANEHVKNTFGKNLSQNVYNKIRMQLSREKLKSRFE